MATPTRLRLPQLDARRRLPALATSRRGALPRIISLIAGTDEETFTRAACTVAADTTNYKINGRGWQMTMTAAAAASIQIVSGVIPNTGGAVPSVPPIQACGAWVYLPDAAKVDYVQITLYCDAANAISWTRDTAADGPTLTNGWNYIRFKLVASLPTNWTNTLNSVRVKVQTNAATTATIGHVWVECPEKAKLLYVEDHGHKSFVVNALPQLRAAGVPVTWAIDVTLLGTHAGEFPDGPSGGFAERVTEADLATFAAAGDSISFHGWDGAETSAMTDAQLRTDTIKCIKWLQARGYTGWIWRASWVQNLAPNPGAIKGLVLGQAHSSLPSVRLGPWPPRDIHNIPRYTHISATNADLDDGFWRLKMTNSLMVCYGHGVGTGDPFDTTQATFDYFMDKVRAGIAEGWLEPVTFEQLWYESGGSFSDLGGTAVARSFDTTGAHVTSLLP